MTDEQIIEALGFEEAAEDIKKRAVDSVRSVVEIRSGAVVEEYLDDEQGAELERLKQAGDDEAVWSWLRGILGADMSEVYEATLISYLEEIKQRNQSPAAGF
jgi:hypothetical protein